MLPEEIKFLMQLYDSLSVASTLEDKSPFEKKLEYKNKVEKLLKDEQISKQAFDIICQIYSIEQTSSTSYFSKWQQAPSVSRTKTSTGTTFYEDPCGHSSRPSGRIRGGC